MENLTFNRNLVMTRTMYCKKCAAAQRPVISNMTLLYRGNSHTYYCFSIKQNSLVQEYGFTPHLIQKPEIFLDDKNEQFVLFESFCGINGCGIELKLKPDNTWEFYYLELKINTIPINDFIALMNFKATEFYVFI